MMRFLSLLLLCLLLLASCQREGKTNVNTTADGTQQYVTPQNELLLVANEQAYCAIVYPAVANDAQKDACADLAKAIRQHTGANVKRYSDDAEIPDGIVEILIGDTNRSETKRTKATLDRFEYAVSVVNGKVVAVGFDEEMTDSAILYLTDLIDDNPAQLSQGVWSLPLHYAQTCEGEQKILSGVILSALGDSYFGGSSLGREKVWVNLLANKYNMPKYIDGVGGSTVADVKNDPVPIVKRHQNMMSASNIVLVEGGRNDYNHQVPIGEAGSRDTKTFIGAWNVILDGIKAKCPNAMIVMITPWNFPDSDSKPIKREQYINAMKAVAEEQNVYVIDASDPSLTGVDMTDAVFRSQYCLNADDVSHLNEEGMKLVMPRFEKILVAYYADFLAKNNICFQTASAVCFFSLNAPSFCRYPVSISILTCRKK